MNILSLKEKREKLRRSGKYPKDKMKKNKNRSKIPDRGMFYSQKNVFLVVSSSGGAAQRIIG